jgi:hypothetical protein
MNPNTEARGQMEATVEAVAEWASPVAWQQFVTMTFPWTATSETAGKKFKALLNAMEREMRAPIAYVSGIEGRTKTGERCAPHIHAALAAQAPISGHRMEAIWAELTGRRQPQDDDSIQIAPWKEGVGGIEYILKFGTEDWDFRWLELVNPAIKATATHRTNRTLRRQQQDARQRVA